VRDQAQGEAPKGQRDGVVAPVGDRRISVADRPEAVLLAPAGAREQDLVAPRGKAVG
jgi:hypothetical protein